MKTSKRIKKERLRNEIKTILEKEKEQNNFADLDPDNIEYLIEYSAGNFIIYIDSEWELDWETTDAYDAVFAEVLPHVSVLQNKACVRYFSKNVKKQIWILLGSALANADKKESSGLLLKETEKYISDREKELTRIWIVGWMGLISVGALVVNFLFPYLYLKACCFGMIGCLFSVLLGVGKVNISCNAGKIPVLLECASKAAIGAISAFVVTLAVDAGIFLNSNSAGTSFLMVLQVAAGFSERLAPSILENIGANKKGEGK